MELNKLTKLQEDWHIPLNENASRIEAEFNKTMNKPINTGTGFLYSNPDGSLEIIQSAPKEKYVYGVMIDEEDPNPGAVTYIDDARGFIPAHGSDMGSWYNTSLYRDIKPCVLKTDTSTVNYYLQKDNFNLKAEGVNVASNVIGGDGNVMIEFPKLYWDINRQNNFLYVRIGNYKFSDTAVCYAHTDGASERDKLYLGAYKGFAEAPATDALASIAGKQPNVSQTIATFRTSCRKWGPRYNIATYWSHVMVSILALIMYRHRNLQQVLGEGFCRAPNYTGQLTGDLNGRPFCWGSVDGNDVAERGKTRMKFLGMEDFYGGIWEFCDGIVMNNYIYKATTNSNLFSDTGANYEKILVSGLTSTANNGTYMKYVKGTNEFPFLVDGSKPNQGIGASEITYWTDGAWFNNTSEGYSTTICLFGGSWGSAGRVGAFCWNLNDAPSLSLSTVGARLQFL